jgi:hypothetical protein
VAAEDEAIWAMAEKKAKRRGISSSKAVANSLRDFVADGD